MPLLWFVFQINFADNWNETTKRARNNEASNTCATHVATRKFVKIDPNAMVATDISFVALIKQVGERVGPKQQLEIQAQSKV